MPNFSLEDFFSAFKDAASEVLSFFGVPATHFVDVLKDEINERLAKKHYEFVIEKIEQTLEDHHYANHGSGDSTAAGKHKKPWTDADKESWKADADKAVWSGDSTAAGKHGKKDNGPKGPIHEKRGCIIGGIHDVYKA